MQQEKSQNKSAKTFSSEFEKFKKKLESKENFAFSRFSDGELHMLQNMYFKITDDHFVEGDKVGYCRYTKEEHKEFDPERHKFYRDKLEESFTFKKPNYFKGICAEADVGEEDFKWQLELNGNITEDLTFSNVFINANYPRFINEIFPLLKERKIIFVVNEKADVSGLNLDVIKTFKVGSNCIVNDYHLSKDIPDYIEENGIEDAVILCSAASLSNFIIHEGFKSSDKNTFLDIGSALNPFIGLEGWQYSRAYLQHHVLGHRSRYGEQVDVW